MALPPTKHFGAAVQIFLRKPISRLLTEILEKSIIKLFATMDPDRATENNSPSRRMSMAALGRRDTDSERAGSLRWTFSPTQARLSRSQTTIGTNYI
ncbi:hypothetical protein TNCV_4995261 [Trichonephila clavipes]|nr:hypothetical protein TNCV_4995261 [Trichonephila clavipes]